MEAIEAVAHVTTATSPLSGQELMARLAIPAGPLLGRLKAALTDAVVLRMGHGELARWLSTTPSVAEHLLRTLARRLRRTNDVLADLVFTDVPGRVAKALLDLAGRFGRPVEEGVMVAHDLTQEELAQLVGASRETVNKALADFASRGWLRLEARAVLLLDVERLRRRAR